MWLWLWRGCPVCALSAQSLQRGPQPAEVQALPGLWADQPLPEGQLFHHQQRSVWRLPARVSVRNPEELSGFVEERALKVTVGFLLLLHFCWREPSEMKDTGKHVFPLCFQILQEDQTERFPGYGVHTLWRPSASL